MSAPARHRKAGRIQKVRHGPLDIDKDVKDEEVMAGEVMDEGGR